MIQAGITLLFQAGIFCNSWTTCGHGMRGSLCLITRLRFGTLSAPRPIITESQPVTAIQSWALCQSQISPLATTDSQALADLADRLPVDAFGFVAIFFGTAVNHQF